MMGMIIKKIQHILIDQGMNKDPRGNEGLADFLAEEKVAYEKLSEQERAYFDPERLSNPYSDSRILFGDPNLEIANVICGIDVEVQDLLLVDRLIEKGERIDLVLAHHPEGKALLGLNQVMSIQEDMMAHHGVPINVAQGMMASRIGEVKRGFLPYNVQRGVDAARLLDLPFMCVHTPADNQVQSFLEVLFREKKPKTVGQVVKLLEEIPEYQEAKKIGAGPVIVCGSEERKAGKILVDMTGGTSGSEKAYEKLATAGVGTIVAMHMGEAHRKEAEKYHINVVIAGHMASDSLGMNLLLDELRVYEVNIIPFSGLIRVER